MKVIVDTCIWSYALRRRNKPHNPTIGVLRELISESRVQMIGPIRQEILSGIKSAAQFGRLSEILRAYPDLQLVSEDYESAARLFNRCRRKGVQGSNTDFLICALSIHHQMPIFTTDKDFLLYQRYIDIELYRIRE